METIYQCNSCANTCTVNVVHTKNTVRTYPPEGCVYGSYNETVWNEIVDDSIQTEDGLDRARKVPLDVDPGRKVSHVS